MFWASSVWSASRYFHAFDWKSVLDLENEPLSNSRLASNDIAQGALPLSTMFNVLNGFPLGMLSKCWTNRASKHSRKDSDYLKIIPSIFSEYLWWLEKPEVTICLAISVHVWKSDDISSAKLSQEFRVWRGLRWLCLLEQIAYYCYHLILLPITMTRVHLYIFQTGLLCLTLKIHE